MKDRRAMGECEKIEHDWEQELSRRRHADYESRKWRVVRDPQTGELRLERVPEKET